MCCILSLVDNDIMTVMVVIDILWGKTKFLTPGGVKIKHDNFPTAGWEKAKKVKMEIHFQL